MSFHDPESLHANYDVLAMLLAASQTDKRYAVERSDGTGFASVYVWGFDAELGTVAVGTRTEVLAKVPVSEIASVREVTP